MSARTKSYWIGGSCVLAVAIQLGWAASSSAQSQTPQTAADQPPTVVVTAEKRKDVVLNVPMGITALSGAQLARTQ
jgi:hypothetical protein